MNNDIGRELRALNNLIRRYMDNSSHHKKTVESFTGTNSWIIGYLSDHMGQNIYQKDLEREFSITRSTASKVINLMAQKGLIERHSVSHDARLKKLVLTDKALELSKLMAEDCRRVESVLTKGFSDDELDTLHGYIRRMKENLS